MTCNYINVVVLVKYLMEDIKVNIDTDLHHLFSYAKKRTTRTFFAFALVHGQLLRCRSSVAVIL